MVRLARIVPFVAGLGLTLTATACSNGSRDQSTLEGAGGSRTVSQSVFSRSAEHGAFQPLLDSASSVEQRLGPRYLQAITGCMAKRGYSYQATSVAPARIPANPYALVTSEEQAAGGYFRADPRTTSDPNSAYLATLSVSQEHAWDTALLGTGQPRTKVQLPSGAVYDYAPSSCAATAKAEVFGPTFSAAEMSVRDLASSVASLTLDDPRVVSATMAWQSCVARQGGGAVSGLGDVRTHALFSPAGDPEAARLFGIDLTCEREAELPAVLADVQHEQEVAAARAFPGPLVALGNQQVFDGGGAAG